MEIFFIGIMMLVIGGIVSLFCPEKLKLKVVSSFSCLASLLILTTINSFTTTAVEFAPFGQIIFDCDGLSKFFIIVISLVTMLVSIYANGYMKPYLDKGKKVDSHSFFFPLLTAAMLLVVSVQNVFAFLVVWEIMSLA